LYPEQSDKLIAQVYSESKPQAAKNTAELEVINRHQEAIDEYIKYVVAKIGPESQRKIKQMGLKLLIDPNGGAALVVLSQLFSELGVEAEIINNQPGQFNRLIEPKAESLSYLSDRMASNDFAFAVGFDCDADRMEIVLSPSSAFAKKMGTPNVSGNYVLALACDAILRGTKGEVVPTNDVTSYLVRDVIKKYGAAIDEVEVGEINVVEAMEAKDSIIGGEGSCAGVIVFPIKCRDGLITMVLALKLIADEGKGLSEILNNYPEYFSDRTKVASSPERAVVIRGKIEEYFEAKNWLVKKTGDATGGLKAHLDENSYVWFRQSKTEPGVFRIYAEGDGSQKKVTDLLGEGVRAFNQFNN
jgi:phosphomannomutase